MPLGATYYDNSRGASLYPLRPGFVLHLTKPRLLVNKEIGAKAEHHVFIWILHDSPVVMGDRAQDKAIHVFWCFVPMLAGLEDHMITRQRKIRIRSLIKSCSRGYDIVADGIRWHRTDQSAKTFYRAIGAYLGLRLL